MCRGYEKLLLNCTINLLTIFLYNIDKKQRKCGYNEKNDKLKQDIYTEPIDELILKLNKIY